MTFFGADIDLDIAETLLLTRWPDKERRLESALFASKDWDERASHPVVSTYRFIHLFTTETRAIIRAHVDDTPPTITQNGRVKDWEPIKGGDPLEPPASDIQAKRWTRKIGSIIRARQWADQHGVPYQFMIRTALKKIYFGRFYLLEYTKLPDPGLLNGEEMREHILLSWVEQLEAKIQHGTHDRYRLANANRHPDVGKHQVWILSQIKRRSHPHFALATFFKQDLLDPRVATLVFGDAKVQRALKLIA